MRKCGPAVRPVALPDAGTLVDVEMVTAVLGSTVPADGEGLLVSLLYRRGATRPSIHILAPEALTPDSMAHIVAVLEPNLREVSAETQPYAVRLRVRGGATRRPSAWSAHGTARQPLAWTRKHDAS